MALVTSPPGSKVIKSSVREFDMPGLKKGLEPEGECFLGFGDFTYFFPDKMGL
jgi:hypothetical protein